ncbi:MAG: DUF1338 domain-containing protein [Elusimicrobia bacterium]|nr:DUF1338 domain-containing protein [Elusimicrobiota bacterium]
MQAPHRAISAQTPKEKFLVELLDSLWERYRSRVEYARRYEEMVEKLGATFLNDHIAFRTIALQEPQAGIFRISRLFEPLGYSPAGVYEFPDKHLSAVHYRHRNPGFPKLFISELKSWELSDKARAIIARTLQSHRAPLSDLTVAACESMSGRSRSALLNTAVKFFAELPWGLAQKEDVPELNKESQFGAWVLVNGYDVNHFTASVDSHGTSALGDIEKTVTAMKRVGIPMKAEIEGERGSKLRQSATEAVVIEVAVKEGHETVKMPWPYAYFEVAERPWVTNPATGKSERFEGFLGAQALHLFEMTRKGQNPRA